MTGITFDDIEKVLDYMNQIEPLIEPVIQLPKWWPVSRLPYFEIDYSLLFNTTNFRKRFDE